MVEENIETLDVYWYETFNEDVNDIPSFVEAVLLQKFFLAYGHLPKWNEKL
jgi:hypothetical protein